MRYKIFHIGFFETEVEAESEAEALDLADRESYDWSTWMQLDKLPDSSDDMVLIRVHSGELTCTTKIIDIRLDRE